MISCSTLSSQSDRQRIYEEQLYGTWYLISTQDDEEVYTRDESLRPRFSFWEDGSMNYTHCQDPCGCMAAVFYGNWRKRKNKVRITFDIFEDGFIFPIDDRFKDVNFKRVMHLKSISKDTLRIVPYIHYMGESFN